MRTRDLKPDFWTDEKVVQVSDAAKLLFQGLWNLADREGRLEDKPVAIGFKVRPWEPARVPALLDELEFAGLIVRYEAERTKCICIPTLPAHQRMHPREMASKLPPPPGGGGAGRGKARQGAPRQVIAPGSAGSSGSAKPSGPAGPSGSSGSTPPLPPSDEGGSKEVRSCTCTRRPCRHEKLPKPAPPCAACGQPAGCALVDVWFCYGCLPDAERWAVLQNPDEPWKADVASWAAERKAGADPPQLRLVGGAS